MPSLEFESEVMNMTNGEKMARLTELQEQIEFLKEHLSDLPLVTNSIASREGLGPNELEIVNHFIKGFNLKRFSYNKTGIAKALDYDDDTNELDCILQGLILKGVINEFFQGTVKRYGLNIGEIKSWR